MDEFIEEILLPLIIVIIFIVVYIAFSTKKDKKKDLQLENYLNAVGFVASGKMKISDMNHPACPFSFMVDFKNKKWVFAKYRSENADIYDFSDIVDYHVILRSKGTNMLKGEKRIINSSPNGENGVLKSERLDDNNCEYIAIELNLKGKAITAVNMKFVMYECQDSGGELSHADFIFPKECIDNALQLEQWLHEILCYNKEIARDK